MNRPAMTRPCLPPSCARSWMASASAALTARWPFGATASRRAPDHSTASAAVDRVMYRMDATARPAAAAGLSPLRALGLLLTRRMVVVSSSGTVRVSFFSPRQRATPLWGW